MKKKFLDKWSNPLVAVSVVLYLIALCIGITAGGTFPYVLLLVATVALTITLVDAIKNNRSLYTLFFRLMLFFICWAAIFENRDENLLESILGVMACLCGIVLVARFVYYMNKYGVRDAEQHLDD